MSKTPTTWVEVNLSAIRHNVREVRALVSQDVSILAVVKADAYGLGSVEVSKAVLAEGASRLGVTRIEDALELRQAGIDAPILVFTSVLPECAPIMVDQNLDATVCSSALAGALSEAARTQRRIANVHVKVDTGLGRLGVHPQEAVDFTRAVAGLPGLSIAGVYTHLAKAADKDTRSASHQLGTFDGVVKRLRTAELKFGLAHAAASAAMLRFPKAHFSMVRPGTVLYGQYPSQDVPKRLILRDPWAFKSRIAFTKAVPAGSYVGYGSEYRAARPTTIAIIPVGYADGLTMLPESVIRRGLAIRFAKSLVPGQTRPTLVKIRGKSCPIIGRIAMEMCAVDVTGLGVEVGDEATLPSRRTAVNARIPRLYVNDEHDIG